MAKFHETLNKKLFDGDKMRTEVRAKLKEIAHAFIEFLEIPKDAVIDTVITGSSVSYNYTEHSDIDLHIIVDPEKVHEDCPIVGEYLLAKKSEFNQKHDIYIYGIPVEVYAEVEGQGTVHNGLYSLDNGWIDFPKKLEPTDNDMAVKAKYEEYVEAAKEIKEGDLAEKLLDKIKKMRKAGLADGGEFSVENLVFKKLRDNGVIEKLMKVKKEDYDKKLSLGKVREALDLLGAIATEIDEMMGGINTGVSAFGQLPINLAGKEMPTKVKVERSNKQKNADLRYKYQKIRGKKI